MSEPPPWHAAWTDALPSVLALLPGARRGLFRQEIQRFLAACAIQPAEAEALSPPLRALLLEAARAARTPAAIQATRGMPDDRATLLALCHHLMAIWRDAEAATLPAPAIDGLTGAVFFGPRLGGPGRVGAVPHRPLDPGPAADPASDAPPAEPVPPTFPRTGPPGDER